MELHILMRIVTEHLLNLYIFGALLPFTYEIIEFRTHQCCLHMKFIYFLYIANVYEWN